MISYGIVGGGIQVDIQKKLYLSTIAPRDIALLSIGMLIHDIAKPYKVGGKFHSLVGFLYLIGDLERAKSLICMMLNDEELAESLKDQDLYKISIPVLFHHTVVVDKGEGRVNLAEYRDKIDCVLRSVSEEYVKLSAIISHDIDFLASTVHGVIEKDRKCLEMLKGNRKRFELVNPFTRRKIAEHVPVDENDPKEILKYMNQESVNEVKAAYTEEASERTFEPICDIPLYEHGRFAAAISFSLLASLYANNVKVVEVREGGLRDLLNYVGSFSWLVISLERFDEIVSRSIKLHNLGAFSALIEAVKDSIVEVLRDYTTRWALGSEAEKDPVFTSLIKEIVPLTTFGRVIVALLPTPLARRLLNDFSDGTIIKRIRDKILCRIGEHDDEVRGGLANILSSYIGVSTAEIELKPISNNYKDLAERMRKGLISAIEHSCAPRSIMLSNKPFRSICWFCGVNPANAYSKCEKPYETYRYGLENVNIYACKACRILLRRFAENTDLRIQVEQIPEEKEYLRDTIEKLKEPGIYDLDEVIVYVGRDGFRTIYKSTKWFSDDRGNIALVIVRPNLSVIHDSWMVTSSKDIVNLAKFMCDLKTSIDNLLSRYEMIENVLRKIIRGETKEPMRALKGVIKICSKIPKGINLPAESILKYGYPLNYLFQLYSLREEIICKINRILILMQENKILESIKEMLEQILHEIGEVRKIYMLYRQIFEKFSDEALNYYPIIKIYSNLDEICKKENISFLSYPPRLGWRTRYWNKFITKVTNKLRNLSEGIHDLIVFSSSLDSLIILARANYLWTLLGLILSTLRDLGFDTGDPVPDIIWSCLDVDMPAATISVYIAKYDYSLYRLLNNAFNAEKVRFIGGHKYPFRVYIADLRTGFDPGLAPYAMNSLWVFSWLYDIVNELSDEDLSFVHRVIMRSSCEKNAYREALAYILHRRPELLTERSTRFRVFAETAIDLLLSEYAFYIFTTLINIRRYCLGSSHES